MTSKLLTRSAVVIVLLLTVRTDFVYAQSDSQERPVAAFSKLVVQNGIDVYLTQSDRNSLRIEVDGYDLEDVVAEVQGDTLTLSRGRSGNRLFGSGNGNVTAYLDFVELAAIRASSGSDIHGRSEVRSEQFTLEASGGSDIDLDVRAQTLDARTSGGSDLRLGGRIPSLTIDASGGSDVAASSLEADSVKLVLSGGSDASVRASAAVEVDARGGSDVAVYGNPGQRTVRNDRSSDVAWR
jgi:Putative auto-transporter adhesin, head GIN domain